MAIAKFDSPHEAVFLKKFAKQSRPLFANQVVLATAIKENKEGGFEDKSTLTIRSAISQIFTGERNLSKSLKYALFLAIKKNFDHTKYNYDAFEKALLEKFKILYENRIKDERDKHGDRDYTSLMEATRKGKEFLITTLEPAESHQSELADNLKEQLLEKTGIIVDSDKEVVLATYKFYFPDKEEGRTAREFWESLRDFVQEEYSLSLTEANERLLKANKDGTILTYLAPLDIALHPYVFINYSILNRTIGFCVSYRNKIIPSVAELSYNVVYAWFGQYKQKLKDLEGATNDKGKKINCFYYEP